MTVKYRAVAPLLHFEAEDEAQLADGLVIRRMKSDDWSRWESRVRGLLHVLLEGDNATPTEFVLSVELSTESKELGPPIFQKLFEVVTTLRLFDAGNVGTPFMEYEIETDRGARQAGHTIWSEELGIRRYGQPFRLRTDRVDRLRSYVRDVEGRLPLEEGTGYAGLAFALRRFNYAYARNRADDRLVDVVIGFEALLLSKDDDTKGTPLARRASRLLGRTNIERENLQKFIKVAYDARNDIVHGGKPIAEALAERIDLTPLGFVTRLERHLAGVIIAVVALPSGMSHKALLRELDQSR